jgi:tetratricopeptide (TPR) repeat protein
MSGLRELGLDFVEEGNWEKALAVFAEAVRRQPDDHRSRILAARCYAKLGETERAVTVFHACAEALLRRDYLLSAIAACRQALPLAPREKTGRKRKRGEGDDEGASPSKRARLDEARLAQGSHLQAVFQRIYRAFGATPDLLVVGELDVSHKDYASIVNDPRVRVTAHSNPMACQSFSSFSDTRVASQAEAKYSGIGYVIYSVGGATIAFVHVPNEIASNKDKTQIFYEEIARQIRGASGKCINMIIGDTNQPGFNHTLRCLGASTAFPNCEYESAVKSQATLVDTHVVGAKTGHGQMTVKGTNSAATKMFDVAIYCTKCIKLEGAVHFSQSGTGTTVTDHAGLAVKFAVK